jgi:hypothetical protein
MCFKSRTVDFDPPLIPAACTLEKTLSQDRVMDISSLPDNLWAIDMVPLSVAPDTGCAGNMTTVAVTKSPWHARYAR